METETKPKRKTFTSSKVKNKWIKENYKRINVALDKTLINKFDEKIKEKNITRTEFIRNCIIEFLEK